MKVIQIVMAAILVLHSGRVYIKGKQGVDFYGPLFDFMFFKEGARKLGFLNPR